MGHLTDAQQAENAEKFKPWIIAHYSHWTLYLNTSDQGLPGRMYAWLKHHVDDMSAEELTNVELLEFYYTILPGVRSALLALGWPLVRLNHEWLGNEIDQHGGHGHFHITPRYSVPFMIGSRIFTDLEPNRRRSTPKLKLPEDELLVIRERLRGLFMVSVP